MRQLDERNLTIVKAAEQLESSRRANKQWFDEHQRLRTENQQLKIGDLILLHQTIDHGNCALNRKLQDRWAGPYRITEVPPNSTFYRLEELDGTPCKDKTVAGNRIKKFFKRIELDALRQEMHDTIRVMSSPEDREVAEIGEDGEMVEIRDEEMDNGIMDEDLI